MRSAFKKVVAIGVLATGIFGGMDAALADHSYYNNTAVRKPGERHVAAARYVEKNCWRPKTDEGRDFYPAAVAAIMPESGTPMAQSLYERVVAADIAFCPAQKKTAGQPIAYDSEERMLTGYTGMHPDESLAYLRKAAFQALLMSDPANKLLDTASTEKRIRYRLYTTVAGVVAEVAMAAEEKENGRPAAWEAMQKHYDNNFDSALVDYKGALAAGGTREEALSAAGLAAYRAVMGMNDWVRYEMRGELMGMARQVNAGNLDDRPVDDDDSKLEAVFRRSAQLTPAVNFATGLSPLSREELFSPYPDVFHDVQGLDLIRYESGYGANSGKVRETMSEMQRTGNPLLKSLKDGPKR